MGNKLCCLLHNQMQIEKNNDTITISEVERQDHEKILFKNQNNSIKLNKSQFQANTNLSRMSNAKNEARTKVSLNKRKLSIQIVPDGNNDNFKDFEKSKDNLNTKNNLEKDNLNDSGTVRLNFVASSSFLNPENENNSKMQMVDNYFVKLDNNRNLINESHEKGFKINSDEDYKKYNDLNKNGFKPDLNICRFNSSFHKKCCNDKKKGFKSSIDDFGISAYKSLAIISNQGKGVRRSSSIAVCSYSKKQEVTERSLNSSHNFNKNTDVSESNCKDVTDRTFNNNTLISNKELNEIQTLKNFSYSKNDNIKNLNTTNGNLKKNNISAIEKKDLQNSKLRKSSQTSQASNKDKIFLISKKSLNISDNKITKQSSRTPIKQTSNLNISVLPKNNNTFDKTQSTFKKASLITNIKRVINGGILKNRSVSKNIQETNIDKKL